ncbi:hypothetical protein HMPREF0262_02142 [Clostridium sp. ATCC 29733]|nr:hypothetical protein HMPREF0262_02142 [Clostridium sp. ATCC 29733]
MLTGIYLLFFVNRFGHHKDYARSPLAGKSPHSPLIPNLFRRTVYAPIIANRDCICYTQFAFFAFYW